MGADWCVWRVAKIRWGKKVEWSSNEGKVKARGRNCAEDGFQSE